MSESPDKALPDVVREDGRYPLSAFSLLHDGLRRAVKHTYGDEAGGEEPQHVSGRQLCEALRDESIERWGLLARTVLARWNIHATVDFGNMVYLLIDHGLMRKTEQDSLEDFRDVYDFDSAFGPEAAFDSDEG